MAKYYCILFDADNTLLDFDAAERKALAETLAQYNIEPSERALYPLFEGDRRFGQRR